MNTSFFGHGVLAADLEAVHGFVCILSIGPIGIAWEFLRFRFFV